MVIYIHGWDNDADPQKTEVVDDLNGFKLLLGKRDFELERRSKKRGDNSLKHRVIGVYVGWRGKSQNGLAHFLTVGSRAQVADRIGKPDGQLAKDLHSLVHGVLSQNKDSRILIMGHSLGGRMLTRMLAPRLEEALESGKPFAPFGKQALVVTLNSASPASRLRNAMALAKKSNAVVAKTRPSPYWMDITSEDDWGTKTLFPAAAFLGFSVTEESSTLEGRNTAGHHGEYWQFFMSEGSLDRSGVSAKGMRDACALTSQTSDVKPTPTEVAGYNWLDLGSSSGPIYSKLVFSKEAKDYEIAFCKKYSSVSYGDGMWVVRVDKTIIGGSGWNAKHSAFVQTNFWRLLDEYLFTLK